MFVKPISSHSFTMVCIFLKYKRVKFEDVKPWKCQHLNTLPLDTYNQNSFLISHISSSTKRLDVRILHSHNMNSLFRFLYFQIHQVQLRSLNIIQGEKKQLTLYWLIRLFSFCLLTSLSLMSMTSSFPSSKSSIISGESTWSTIISSSTVLVSRFVTTKSLVNFLI